MANFPYEPRVYRPNSTIAQLMLEQGNQQADSARNLWGGIGQTIAGVGQAAGQVIQQKQEQQKVSKQDQAFLSRLSDPNAPPLTPQDAVRIYGPERGMAIFKGYQSLQSPEPDLRTVIAGFEAASPEMRAQAWPAARAHLTKAGVPGVPEQYDEGYFQRFKQAVSGEKPAAPYSLIPGEKRFGPDNKLLAENPALEKPEKPGTLEEQLVKAQVSGDTALYGKLLKVKAESAAAGRGPETREWVIRDGSPVRVSESQIRPGDMPATQRERPVTGIERTALGFFNRAKNAVEDLTPLEDKIQKSGLFDQGRLKSGVALFQSDDQQKYNQAQRAFTEARLRKESGAAIPPEEYANDARTYFAQPGDSKAAMEQKKKARNVVLDGLKYGAGNAYKEYYGEAPTHSQAAIVQEDTDHPGVFRHSVDGGNTWIAGKP